MKVYKIVSAIVAIINTAVFVAGAVAFLPIVGSFGMGYQGVKTTGIFWQFYLFIAAYLFVLVCAGVGCLTAIKYFVSPTKKLLAWMIVTTLIALPIPLRVLIGILFKH